MADDPDKPSLSERLTRLFLKAETGGERPDPYPTSVEGLEEAIARADDKERLIGLIAAPLAGGIGLLVAQSLAAHGTTKAASSTSQVLAISLLVLAAAMLASAWFRKRLYLGIAMCPLRPVDLQPALLGVRGPLPPVRRVVPGPGLPAAAEAEAGPGRRRHAAAPEFGTRRPRPGPASATPLPSPDRPNPPGRRSPATTADRRPNPGVRRGRSGAAAPLLFLVRDPSIRCPRARRVTRGTPVHALVTLQ